jgi:hypothetical protein
MICDACLWLYELHGVTVRVAHEQALRETKRMVEKCYFSW